MHVMNQPETLQKVHTPDIKTIESVSDFFERTTKTVSEDVSG